MKRLLAAALLAGTLCSCTEHVYTHRKTSVWQSSPSYSSSGSSYYRSSSAPAASIRPYVEESVEAVRAE